MKQIKIFSKTLHKLDTKFKEYDFHTSLGDIEESINRWINKTNYNIISIDFKIVTPERHNNGGCDWTMIIATIMYEG